MFLRHEVVNFDSRCAIEHVGEVHIHRLALPILIEIDSPLPAVYVVAAEPEIRPVAGLHRVDVRCMRAINARARRPLHGE